MFCSEWSISVKRKEFVKSDSFGVIQNGLYVMTVEKGVTGPKGCKLDPKAW